MHPLANELNNIYEQLNPIYYQLVEKLERELVPGGGPMGYNREGKASKHIHEALNEIQLALEALTL